MLDLLYSFNQSIFLPDIVLESNAIRQLDFTFGLVLI